MGYCGMPKESKDCFFGWSIHFDERSKEILRLTQNTTTEAPKSPQQLPPQNQS
jgi:hypothetical protein